MSNGQAGELGGNTADMVDINCLLFEKQSEKVTY